MKIAEVWVKAYDADDLRALENMPLEDVIQGLEWYRAHMSPWNMICEQEIENGRVYSAERYEATKRAMALYRAIDILYQLNDGCMEIEPNCKPRRDNENMRENWDGTH